MAEFRRMIKTLFVMLLSQFTAAGQSHLSSTARAGQDVVLPCTIVTNHQDRCDGTSWVFSRDGDAVELISLGQTGSNELAKAKSGRLSVTADCSLAVRNVTADDAGRYTCRQFRSEVQQGPGALVVLSVVTVTEDQLNDTVTLFCTVLTSGQCGHRVQWLIQGDTNNVDTRELACSATVIFPTLHLKHTSNYYEFLKCNVTEYSSGTVLLCDVDPQSTCEVAGGSTSAGKNDSSSAKNDPPTPQRWLWLYILTAVVLSAVLAAVVVVVVIRRRRTNGNQTQMEKNTADPEDGVSYASVSYTKKTSGAAQVLGGGGDDEGGAVTYSSVKASSSSAADLSDLYATVNKPNK